jgi:hypothetical protein
MRKRNTLRIRESILYELSRKNSVPRLSSAVIPALCLFIPALCHPERSQSLL